MAAALNTDNFIISGSEIGVKLYNLTHKYREEKKKVGPSGGCPSKWSHFNKVHQILGSYKSFNVEVVMVESTSEMDFRPGTSSSSYVSDYPRISRVYKTSYPIYSSYPVISRTRVISSPIRIVTSPTRIVTRYVRSPSPVRVTQTRTTRIISSPERTSSYSYTLPSTYYSSSSYLPSTYYSSSSYLPSSYYSSSYYLPSSYYNPSYIPSYYYSSPSYLYSPTSRIYSRSLSPVRVTPSYLKRFPPGYGAQQLTNYLNTEPFTTFREETDRIRHRAQSLIRDIHTPVFRRARSATPFPLSYEPVSKLALDAYVARITDPLRHVANEVHNMDLYPEPAHKYFGKSHLASVRICGDKAYNIRSPMYDSDRVRNNINLLSWYLKKGLEKKEKQVDDKKTIEEVDLDPARPSRKFGATKKSEEPVNDDDVKEKQRLRKERLLTVNEEMLDEIEMEKKKALREDEAKRRQEKSLEEGVRQQAKEKQLIEDERKEQIAAEEARRVAEEEKKAEESRLARLAEEQRLAEEARKAAEEAEAARLADETRLAEEARLEAEAKEAEEAARREEEARLEEEQRQIEKELKKLAEIERQAEEEREAQLARQAAELAEIARHEAEIAAQVLQTMQGAGKESETDTNNTAIISSEPIVNEPPSPVEEDVHGPTIEFNSNIDDINAQNDDTADSGEEEEEEEEDED